MGCALASVHDGTMVRLPAPIWPARDGRAPRSVERAVDNDHTAMSPPEDCRMEAIMQELFLIGLVLIAGAAWFVTALFINDASRGPA